MTPSDLKPSVLPEKEVRLVSLIRDGGSFAQSGRLTAAEESFRRALILAPDLSNLYNDLGYVLVGQLRLDEAIRMFYQALDLQPENLAARKNLAHALYSKGDYERAEEMYQQVLILHYQATIRADGKLKPLVPVELSQIFRDLAILSYVIGETDEAVCYSQLALDHNPNVDETGRHARLLLALNDVPAALQVLERSMASPDGLGSSKLVFDYGLALYASGNTGLAQEAFERVLRNENADPNERRSARVLQLVSWEHSSLDAAARSGFADTVHAALKEDKKICSNNFSKENDYWPQKVTDDVEELLTQNCNES